MKKISLNFNGKKELTIAIIGFGRFGQLLTKIFLQCSNAHIQVVSSKKPLKNHKRLSFVELKEISLADLVIPCVPISAFKKTTLKIAPLLKDSAVVMDVCSVKVLPMQIMRKHLPKNVQVIASHPMFGPDSFRINKGLKSLKLVLYNVTASKSNYVIIKSFFEQLGLTVIKLTPQKHDKLLAWSLGYSYLVGKIGQRLKLKETPIDAHDFTLLLQNIEIVSNDSDQLFMDMQIHNPFAKEVHNKFIKVTEEILNEIRLKENSVEELGSGLLEH